MNIGGEDFALDCDMQPDEDVLLHPKQRKIIEMDKAAAKSGRGSFALDGKMIDIPLIVRAQKLLQRHEAIRRRESKTLAAAKG